MEEMTIEEYREHAHVAGNTVYKQPNSVWVCACQGTLAQLTCTHCKRQGYVVSPAPQVLNKRVKPPSDFEELLKAFFRFTKR